MVRKTDRTPRSQVGRRREDRFGVELSTLIGFGRTAAFGASCPFRLVLANVPSPNPQQPFALGDTVRSRAWATAIGGALDFRLSRSPPDRPKVLSTHRLTENKLPCPKEWPIQRTVGGWGQVPASD